MCLRPASKRGAFCCDCGNSLSPGFAASLMATGSRAPAAVLTHEATNTPRSHSRPRRGFGHCDRTRSGLAGQRARSGGPSGHDHVNCAPRPTVVERRSSHSIGESSRRRETLPNRSNPRYVPRWSRHPLRVQRWEGGRWLDFPLPAVTDQAGQFTAYVELGGPGRYRLRCSIPTPA